MMYAVGGPEENEILLFGVVLALRDSLSILLKSVVSLFRKPSPFFFLLLVPNKLWGPPCRMAVSYQEQALSYNFLWGKMEMSQANMSYDCEQEFDRQTHAH